MGQSGTEGLDFVVCRVCGHHGSKLYRHLATHGLNTASYLVMYGADAPLRCTTAKTKQDSARTIRLAGESKTWRAMKVVVCPTCGAPHQVGKQMGSLHDLRCPPCKVGGVESARDALWAGKVEGTDYVVCRECGHRAENLTSHVTQAHPGYRVHHPSAVLVTDGSAVRDKTAIRIDLTVGDLSPFMDARGRVEVAQAAEGLGCSWRTVLLRCRKWGLPTRNRLALQKRVLDAVSEILDEDYVWEWSHAEIVSQHTGYRLYFDGLFVRHNLIVEVHGAQHYRYIPYWHKTMVRFEECQRLDAWKEQEVRRLGYEVMVVRYDDPFTDPAYLAGRLAQLGMLSGEAASKVEGSAPTGNGDILDLFD